MIANNGYAMIDCKGCNLLAQSSQTISGLYAACAAAVKSGKPIIAVNCNYGTGVPMTPINVFGIVEDGVYVFTASILQIRVATGDTVTITPLINSEAKSTRSTK